MVTQVRRRVAELLPRAHRFAIGSAWFFAIFSLLHLVWVVAVKGADPAGLTTLYQTSVVSPEGLDVYRAFGLNYDGFPGLLLAMLQATVVASALAFTVWGRGKWRRVSHVVLVGWAGLWMFDLMYLAGVDQQVGSLAQATLMTFLAASTVVRALTPLTPKPRTKQTLPSHTPEPDIVDVDLALPTPDEPTIEASPAPSRRTQAIAHARHIATTIHNRARNTLSRLKAATKPT